MNRVNDSLVFQAVVQAECGKAVGIAAAKEDTDVTRSLLAFVMEDAARIQQALKDVGIELCIVKVEKSDFFKVR